MQDQAAVTVAGLSKLYSRHADNHVIELKSRALRLLGARMQEGHETIWALRDINFELAKGEILGIVGRNGSGKSTLLKILSRIGSPTEGQFSVQGRVCSLLELGAGFHPEFTGRQNIYVYGAILGLSESQIDQKFDAIVAFSEIERFIDTPVKHYSSGMFVRLAFATALQVEADVIIIDEVLSVGDFGFQKKSFEAIREKIAGGATVIFVSHNMSDVIKLCTKSLFLDKGRQIAFGSPAEIVHAYMESEGASEGIRRWAPESAPAFIDGSLRLGAISILASEGNPAAQFDVADSFRIAVEFVVMRKEHVINVHLYFDHELTGRLFVSMDNLDSPWRDSVLDEGTYTATCEIPGGFFGTGRFMVTLCASTTPSSPNSACFTDAVSFEIVDMKKPVGGRGSFEGDWPFVPVRPQLEWEHSDTAPVPVTWGKPTLS